MKHKHTWSFAALAGAVVAGIVVTRFFLGTSSPTEPPDSRASVAVRLAGDGFQQAAPPPDREAVSNNPVAPQEAPAATPHKAVAEFQGWFSRYQQETDAASKARLEAEGEALALQRREAMARLIEEDPQRALETAVSFAQRQQ